ncbi:MAG TPA: signal peptidase I [Caulobacteraceae bacterium]|nr:signal peptidase I [Caulobacteraceae bacterium]
MTDDRRVHPITVFGIAAALVVALAFALLVGERVTFRPFTIPSAADEPTLQIGDYILVSTWSYGCGQHTLPGCPTAFGDRPLFHPPGRGDLVVFKLPRDGRTDFVKRIIGLPGDHVQVRAGVIYVNDHALKRQRMADAMGDLDGNGPPQLAERYLETNTEGRSYQIQMSPTPTPADDTGVYVVPPHCFFMVGDNRDNSADSRFDPGVTSDSPPQTCPWDAKLSVSGGEGVGFVPEGNLIGKVIRVVFSWNRSGPGGKPELRRGRFNIPVN